MAREHHRPFRELKVEAILTSARATPLPSHKRVVGQRSVHCSGTNQNPASVNTYQQNGQEGNRYARFRASCSNPECDATFNFWPTNGVWTWYQEKKQER